jgi:hypothetical protein
MKSSPSTAGKRPKRTPSGSSLRIPSLSTLLARRTQLGYQIPRKLVSLDPGGTTGWAYFSQGTLKHCGQFPGTPQNIEALLIHFKPNIVVSEKYIIYSHKLKEHAQSDVPTLRLIGALEYICHRLSLPLIQQTAQIGKGFCTDDKLKAWSVLQATTQKRHANDAIRHGLYYILFHKNTSR